MVDDDEVRPDKVDMMVGCMALLGMLVCGSVFVLVVLWVLGIRL